MSKRVYISGQMTGIPREEYLARFAKAEELLKQEGYAVVNPARLLPSRWPWLYKMLGYNLTLLYDLWQLSKCDIIYKIPGWKESSGSNIESCWAYHTNICLVLPKIRQRIDLKMAKFIDKANEREEARQRKVCIGAHIGPPGCKPSRPLSEWLGEMEQHPTTSGTQVNDTRSK
jgi:hypothetical protein